LESARNYTRLSGLSFSGVVRLGWYAGGLYNDPYFWGVATHQGDAGEMRGYWGKSIEEEL